ncbi:type II secretion system F family protein [Archaeoglobus veneficus]|uniref:Type II secretion system F domain protein n=1 Tax=Archaeoglobus veneficus (strain DSM 11195 / SNP6) TaxID=693661 RepID=F2KMX2_ARCVS|nr:type II secretion system F family protein [Archaeoglobus veneficus]AEA47248.1 Type II secretion system F domain protein [Archaeoglobus veneficus SNP6]
MFKEANMFTYLGYKLFGESIRKNVQKYYDLEKQLRQAMISMPPEMYIATARMVSLIFAVVGAILGLIISYIVIFFIGLPEVIFPIALPEPIYSFWMNFRAFVFAALLCAMITVALYFAGYFMFTIYPSTVISDRKSKIDRALPHAITFMYSLSRGGMNLIEIFRALSEYYEVYSEVSREAARILRDMEVLGKDLRTALADAVELSPSENFKEFLHGLITIIDSGGDITKYLEDRADFYLERARQDQKNFLEFLGLMAESYITAFVAGPLFLIIIQTVMVVMGQGDETTLYAVIYLVIPIGSFFFAMVIKLLTPTEEGEPPKLREKYTYLRRKVEEREFSDQIKELRKRINSWKFRKALRHPLDPIKRRPMYVFIFSIPAGLAFMFYGFSRYQFSPDIQWLFKVDDYIFLSLVIILAPFVVFYEAGRKKAKRTLRLTPIFLNKLASANESGMPIYRAIAMIAKTDTTPLKKEIQKIKSDLDWGISLNDALIRFANRLRVFELSRTITLLNEALKSTGNVTEVLMISAKDASNAELLRRERLSNMFMYVIIIYISFFVFIGIVYIITTTFLSTLAESAAKVAESGGTGMTMLRGIDVTTYKNVFMHAAVFQGLFAGLVAGVMGEGSLSAGVKHSLLMLVLAYVLFTVLI